jgi:hypothetical protein
VSGRVEGVTGNREVPRIGVSGTRADLRGAWAGANPEEEAGLWGKHGFLHTTEPTAREGAA